MLNFIYALPAPIANFMGSSILGSFNVKFVTVSATLNAVFFREVTLIGAFKVFEIKQEKSIKIKARLIILDGNGTQSRSNERMTYFYIY